MTNRINRVLVTGGAGFIGSHTVDLLIEHDYDVTILDNLEPQVHGKKRKIPDYMNKKAKIEIGDICNRKLLKKLILDVDAVIHLAAMVGVGQSMYQIEHYINVNTLGTANLLDVLINEKNHVEKILVASSMSVYGEGKYHCQECDSYFYPAIRDNEQLKKMQWNYTCPSCGSILTPLPTDEEKPLMPTSIYAISKRHQEEMCLLTGKTYGIPTIALRYFNVYGPRQSLSNPYTGVAAIFSGHILNKHAPYIFEDGKQSRDFIHVKDVAQANLNSLIYKKAEYTAINIGTGIPTSIKKLANILIEIFGYKLRPYVSNKYRKGDVRHCFADVKRAQNLLNFKPGVSLKDGLTELIEWSQKQGWESVDLFKKVLRELRKKQLLK